MPEKEKIISYMEDSLSILFDEISYFTKAGRHEMVKQRIIEINKIKKCIAILSR